MNYPLHAECLVVGVEEPPKYPRLQNIVATAHARLRRAIIPAIRGKQAAPRSALASQVYGPVIQRAEAKRRRLLRAASRFAEHQTSS